MPILEDLMGQYPGIIAGVIAGLVSLSLSFVISFRWRNRKEIAYEVISDVGVWKAKEEAKSRLQVFLDEQQIPDLQVVIIKIKNTGRVPILKANQAPLIKVSFEETARILDAEVTQARPRSAAVSLSLSSNERELSLAPLLLNRKDWVDLKVLLTGFREKIAIDGELDRVKRVDFSKKNTLSYGRQVTSDLICFVMGGVIALLITSLLANLNGLFR